MPHMIGDKVLSFATEIDYATIEQARQTASMPFVHPYVALMPDAHLGKGSSVGTVIPTLDAVIPACVGVDTKAKELFTAEDLAEQMRGIEYRHGEQWIDEIPSCYKDVDLIMKDAKELVEVVTTLSQVLNVKGT